MPTHMNLNSESHYVEECPPPTWIDLAGTSACPNVQQQDPLGQQACATPHKMSELFVVRNCGHVVNVEQPELFNETAIAFLKGQKLVPIPV